MRGHADAAMLAAFREELLSARKAAQVSAHLAACPRCAALEAQLAEVTTLLNRATAPPMPDALTARIQAALAAEGAARTVAAAPHATAAPAAVPAMSGAPAHDDMRSSNGRRGGADHGRRTGWRGHDRSWLALRVSAAAAAVAVIAGGGYGVAQLLTGSPGEHAAISGGAAASSLKVRGPSKVKRPPLPHMSSGSFSSTPRASSGSGSSAGAVAPLVIGSGTNYQPKSLGAQASTVLKHLNSSGHASSRPPPALAPSRTQTSLFPHLWSCLIRVGHGRRPKLVDLAHYLGHPALIVVLPGANGAGAEALAIAPGCTAVLATVPLPHSG